MWTFWKCKRHFLFQTDCPQGSPNCLGRLLTCATQAARNVALPVSSTAACPVGPRSAQCQEATALISSLVVGLAHEAGGADFGNLSHQVPNRGNAVRLAQRPSLP
ncbi:hypothetical protein EYF80_000838 [Liparis tanakae]|uniref:Uncharacterized protein n=1 Tax=Liparis tanakae TaxID=230148 RepID=A0A4Z2JFL1_9TELE|nr:hypothetical protein EYF80_000838 [Liparis tanakae]